jgi:predicted RNA binding protein YcfA (HicA-like mRNA interferase family)
VSAQRLPVVSGAQLVRVLEREGRQVARQRGSHVRLKHPDRGTPLTVPLHRELKRGTLAGILTDARIDADRLRELL